MRGDVGHNDSLLQQNFVYHTRSWRPGRAVPHPVAAVIARWFGRSVVRGFLPVYALERQGGSPRTASRARVRESFTAVRKRSAWERAPSLERELAQSSNALFGIRCYKGWGTGDLA